MQAVGTWFYTFAYGPDISMKYLSDRFICQRLVPVCIVSLLCLRESAYKIIFLVLFQACVIQISNQPLQRKILGVSSLDVYDMSLSHLVIFGFWDDNLQVGLKKLEMLDLNFYQLTYPQKSRETQ